MFVSEVSTTESASVSETHREQILYRGGISPARLRTVIDFVRAKLESSITVETMAKAADLSPAHFGEMFRISTGKTPHQYLLEQRVQRAVEMLRSREAKIMDVALACGFRTQQHFAKVFRRVMGVSPREYRWEHSR